MKEDVILLAGTTVDMEVITLGVSSWQRVPRITGMGAVGEQSDPKEKTTLEDRIKKYGSGMRDAAEKNLEGQYIPVQESGDEYYDDYVLQQAFLKRCRNEEEFNMRVNWPDGEVNGWLQKTLGFQFNEGTQEDWKMFTVNGRQNSRVVFGLSLSGTATVTTGNTTTLTLTTDPSTIDTTDGVVYWSSSDETKATVVDGVVTGVAAGTTTITAEYRGVTASLVVTVS